MIVEGYTLDLYCDAEACTKQYAPHNQPATFAGSSKAKAHSYAKKAGWVIKHKKLDVDECYCPNCVASGNHKLKKP